MSTTTSPAATTKFKNIDSRVREAINKQIAILKKIPQDDPLVISNQTLLALTDESSTWAAAGSLEAAGLAYYGVSCELVLASPDGVAAVEFDAHGWGAVAAAIECEVVGAFVVDPGTIGDTCDWVIVAGAFEEGAVSLTLTAKSGGLIGQFFGNADGIGAFTWGEHNGKLKVKKS